MTRVQRVALVTAAVAVTWAAMTGGRVVAAQSDTSPPPAAPAEPAGAPIQPLAPPAAPPPPGAPPAAGVVPAPITVTEPIATPPPAVTAAPQPAPYYQRTWFWGAVGVVALTAVFVIVVAATQSGNTTPNTTLGDMRAF